LDIAGEVKKAKKGNKDSFINLINYCEASLYRISSAILKKDEECVDAIQEAILKAYYSIHKLKEPSYFKTWITRILINECYKILNNKKK